MGLLTITELLRGVLIWAILAIFFGAIASWIWAIRTLLRGESLLPRAPLVDRRKPPWGVGTILLALVVCYAVSRGALECYALATRGAEARTGMEAPIGAGKKEAHHPAPAQEDGARGGDHQKGPEGPGPDEPGAGPDRRPQERESLPFGLSLTELMFVQGAINCVLIVLLPGIARWTSRARLRDFGLVLRGWRQQAAVGIVAVLLLMPIVYSVQFACITFLKIPDLEKRKHPVERMLREDSSPGVALLAFVTAVVLAPLFEELLFRGLLQSWLVKELNRWPERLRGLHVVLRGWLARVLYRFAIRPHPSASDAPSTAPPPGEPPPVGSVTVTALDEPKWQRPPDDHDRAIGIWDAAEEPGDSTWEADLQAIWGRTKPASLDIDFLASPPSKELDVASGPRLSISTLFAIAVASLFFAALHAAQWPAPIPLFVLAMGLGIVYQRSGSLIAPICMHALFNGFSTLMLFFGTLAGPLKEEPRAKPVLERVAPVEKVAPVAPHVVPTPPRDKS